MLKYYLEVEDNLMASRNMKQIIEVDRKRTMEDSQVSTSSFNDAKFDIMMKTMDWLMDILKSNSMPPNREKPKPQIRNPNFTRPPPPPPLPLKEDKETK